jgi:steroid delta-isomerase-like uncharacterized protein
MNREDATRCVRPFYEALNRPAEKDVAALIEGVANADWRSFSGERASKGRDEFIRQVVGFGKLLPDLAWDVKEVFVDGDRVIVRSEASGTPASDFMGVPHEGRRFAIMTIDVHTIRDGKLATAHHVEDWASAIRQLSAG